MAEQDITSKLEAMNRISELVRQRDDLLAACEDALEFIGRSNKTDWENEITPKLEAAIAKAQPSSTSVQPKKSGVLR